jgi:hypothetical protein
MRGTKGKRRASAQGVLSQDIERRSVLLKLVLQGLGEGHYLDACLVCRAWRDTYCLDLQHDSGGPRTCSKPYVEDAAMWSRVKKLSLHESIAPVSVGQFGCEEVLADKLGPCYLKRVDSVAKPAETAIAATTTTAPTSAEQVRYELVGLVGPSPEKTKALAAKPDSDDDADSDIVYEHYVTADWRAMLQSADATNDCIVGIALGAAKAGRIAVCADALLKWPDVAAQLQQSMKAALIATAKCTNTAIFDSLLRIWLVLTWTSGPQRPKYPSDIDCYKRNRRMQKWRAAAECFDEQCNSSLPLEQFAEQCCDRYRKQQEKQYGSLYPVADTAATMLQEWPVVGDAPLRTELVQSLTRYAIPLVHARCIELLPDTVTSDLLHEVAAKGRTDVLGYLLADDRNGDFTTDEEITDVLNTGALHGDRVVTVKWLQANGFLQDDIRDELVITKHRRIIAYYRELDAKAVAVRRSLLYGL